MSQVNIFLSSSISNEEKAEFKKFLSSVNIECEHSTFNPEIIKKSQYYCLIVKDEIEPHIKEEFDMALNAYRENAKPKILVYFHTDSVRAGLFKSKLDSIDYFYDYYTDIKSIELDLLIELNKSMEYDLKLEDGMAIVNEKGILNLKDLSFYKKNPTFMKIIEQIKEIDEKIDEKLIKYNNKQSNELMNQIVSLTTIKRELIQEKHTIEKEILKLRTFLNEYKTGKRNTTPVIRSVCLLLEQGEYDKAFDVLNEERIDENNIYAYSDECRLRTLVLKIKGMDSKNVEEIYACYKKYMEFFLSIKNDFHDLLYFYDGLYDYVCFLEEQKHFDQAIEIAKKIEDIYGTAEIAYPVYKLMDKLKLELEYEKTFDQVFEYLNEVEIYTRLADMNPNGFSKEFAISYTKLGNLYQEIQSLYRKIEFYDQETNYFKEAEKQYKKVLEIYKQTDSIELVNSYNRLGDLYCRNYYSQEAEICYKKALGICLKLTRENPDTYAVHLAQTYYNLGVLYMNYFHKASSIHLKWDAKKLKVPEYLEIKKIEHNVDQYLLKSKEYDQSKENLEKAFEIQKKLSDKDYALYGFDFIVTCITLSQLCMNKTWGNCDLAKKYCDAALEIYKKLTKVKTDTDSLSILYKKIQFIQSKLQEMNS